MSARMAGSWSGAAPALAGVALTPASTPLYPRTAIRTPAPVSHAGRRAAREVRPAPVCAIPRRSRLRIVSTIPVEPALATWLFASETTSIPARSRPESSAGSIEKTYPRGW